MQITKDFIDNLGLGREVICKILGELEWHVFYSVSCGGKVKYQYELWYSVHPEELGLPPDSSPLAEQSELFDDWDSFTSNARTKFCMKLLAMDVYSEMCFDDRKYSDIKCINQKYKHLINSYFFPKTFPYYLRNDDEFCKRHFSKLSEF